MPTDIRIGKRWIGSAHPTYVVAEMSGNHNGDLDRAVQTVHAAAKSGADAIKLQTYTAETLTIDCNKEEFLVPPGGPWAGRKLYALYEEAHTPWEWHERLFQEARKSGIDIFSTPFDPSAVEFLENLQVPAHKIASFELVDDELLEIVAKTGKPVILSTGMATIEEIAHAIEQLRKGGCSDLVLLRCTSSYPAPDESMNLAGIPVLAEVFGCHVGLSDHSSGTTAPIVAMTMGARLIEKHFTLSKADGGVDSHFSLEPREFARLVTDLRRAERMLGSPSFSVSKAERSSSIFRRSLYVVEDIDQGARFTRSNVRSIRPGFGLAPKFMRIILGRRASRRLQRGTPLTWELIDSD